MSRKFWTSFSLSMPFYKVLGFDCVKNNCSFGFMYCYIHTNHDTEELDGGLGVGWPYLRCIYLSAMP